MAIASRARVFVKAGVGLSRGSRVGGPQEVLSEKGGDAGGKSNQKEAVKCQEWGPRLPAMAARRMRWLMDLAVIDGLRSADQVGSRQAEGWGIWRPGDLETGRPGDLGPCVEMGRAHDQGRGFGKDG